MEILSRETKELLKIPAVRAAIRRMVTANKYPPPAEIVELEDRTITLRCVES